MKRFSISEFSTHHWPLDREVAELKKRGIQSIGLWRTKLSDLDLDESSDLLYAHSLRVSSLSWAGGFTGSCGMSHEDAIADGITAIRTAAKIGAECLIVHAGGRNGHMTRHATRLLRLALDRLVPVASDFGIRLGLELMQADIASGWTFAQTFNETLEMVNQFPARHVGLVLDLYHAGRNRALLNALDEIAPRIALVQLADQAKVRHDAPLNQPPERCLLGHGVVPIQSWVNQLEKHGFDGYYELELHGPGLADIPYRQRLDHSLMVWESVRGNSYSPSYRAH